MAFVKTNNEKKDLRQLLNMDDIFNSAKNNGINTIPFDIYSYINIFNDIEVLEDYLDPEISGMIEYINFGYIITINKYHSENRKRFTLAHELGHYMMHKDFLKSNGNIEDKMLFRNNLTQDKIEIQANEFAAQLLMPEIEFKSAINQGINSIAELAKKFQVSAAAIKYRAYKLGLIREY